MNGYFIIIFVMIFFFHTVNFCEKEKRKLVEKYQTNSQFSYDRQETLRLLAEVLNNSIPEYRKVFEKGFYVNDKGQGIGFFVYDLTDLSNKEIKLNDCIKFKNNHVYHFAPVRRRYSFSHIVVLENGDLTIFKSINCENKGNRLEEVINYLNKKLKNNKDKQKIINRVKNYRKYGVYTSVDTPNPECKLIKPGLTGDCFF